MPNKQIIIGLCGYPRAGKSEVASLLVEEHGFSYISTKELLVDFASKITGLDKSFIRTQSGKAHRFMGRDVRCIMGELGNALENTFGVSFLLEHALEAAKADGLFAADRIVVDSLRKNQADFFNGVIVEVRNKRIPESLKDFDHYEECLVSFVINNDGSLADLSEKVDRLVETLDHWSKI